MDSHHILLGISIILIAGLFAQWIAWRLRLPSILMLLVFGILLGPVFGVVDPDLVLGHMLFPIVSLSVAIILFEGGLVLQFKDIRDTGHVVRNLISIGALVGWLITSVSAFYILNMDMKLSILLGAILIVTGPTVIMPLLKFVRINHNLSSILRWECVTIDTVGAVLAVLVFDVIFILPPGEAIGSIVVEMITTFIAGMLVGLLGAFLLLYVLKKRLIPDFLQESLTLMMVILFYNLGNIIQLEAGLLTVTVMGIVLANQKKVEMLNIITFKENLTVILLSTLFVFLAARLDIEAISVYMHWNMLFFLLILVFIGRPITVFVSTIGSSLTVRERLFLSWMAPRGIVAAAVASLFALKIGSEANALISVTFIVIIFTVCLYGLTTRFVAKWLRVTKSDFRGVLLVGADELARGIAKHLSDYDYSVILVDTNRQHVLDARGDGLIAICGSVLSQTVKEKVELHGMSKLLAMTPSDEVNLLATMEFSDVFSSTNVYRLPVSANNTFGNGSLSRVSEGRMMFGEGMNHHYLAARITAGATVQSLEIQSLDEVTAFLRSHPKAIPMFLLTEKGRLIVYTVSSNVSTAAPKVLVYLA